MFLSRRIAALLASVTAIAFDVTAAGLCGKIGDYEGLPLPGASFNAMNLLTGKSFSTTSDRAGRACLEKIPEGLYAVEVGLQGFLNVRYYPVRVRYPDVAKLSFRLPLGEIAEGGLGQEAVINGTLKRDNAPMDSAEVCILSAGSTRIACTVTNELGEYALSVPPGSYTATIKIRSGKIYRSSVIATNPGLYTDALKLKDDE